MSREHIRQLISAVQNRVRPPDHLPFPGPRPGLGGESLEVGFDDEQATIVVPPDWKRPLPTGSSEVQGLRQIARQNSNRKTKSPLRL